MRDYVKRRPCVTCGVAEAQFRPGGPWFHVMRVDEERCEALKIAPRVAHGSATSGNSSQNSKVRGVKA